MAETVFERDRRIRNANLTMGQTFYLCTLNQFVGKNADAWPSQTTIAERMNATSRAVRKWQSELEQKGVIVVASGKGCKEPNRYSMNLDALPIKPTLNTEPRSAFDPDSGTEYGTQFRNNTEHSSSGIRNTVPTERTGKEQLKEQGISFPEKLRTPEFSEAWQSWLKFRREIKKKLPPSTITKQLKLLATFGSSKAVRSIDCSITNGWQGLFDPETQNGKASDAGSSEAIQAWQTVVDSLKQHSRFKADLIQADIGQRVWQAVKAISGLKQIDEANDFERRELQKRFIQEFNKQGAT